MLIFIKKFKHCLFLNLINHYSNKKMDVKQKSAYAAQTILLLNNYFLSWPLLTYLSLKSVRYREEPFKKQIHHHKDSNSTQFSTDMTNLITDDFLQTNPYSENFNDPSSVQWIEYEPVIILIFHFVGVLIASLQARILARNFSFKGNILICSLCVWIFLGALTKAFPVGFQNISMCLMAVFNEVMLFCTRCLIVEYVDLKSKDIEEIDNLTWSDVYKKPSKPTSIFGKIPVTHPQNNSSFLIPLCNMVSMFQWSGCMLFYFHDQMPIKLDQSSMKIYIDRFDSYFLKVKYQLLVSNIIQWYLLEESKIVMNKTKVFLELQLLTTRRAINSLSLNMLRVDSFIQYCIREEKHQLLQGNLAFISSPVDWLITVNKPSIVDYEVAEENYRETIYTRKFLVIYFMLSIPISVAFYQLYMFYWRLFINESFIMVMVMLTANSLCLFQSQSVSSISLKVYTVKKSFLILIVLQVVILSMLLIGESDWRNLGISCGLMLIIGMIYNLRGVIMPKVYGIDVGVRLHRLISLLDLFSTIQALFLIFLRNYLGYNILHLMLIGLSVLVLFCKEDFKEMNEEEKFTVDPLQLSAGGYVTISTQEVQKNNASMNEELNKLIDYVCSNDNKLIGSSKNVRTSPKNPINSIKRLRKKSPRPKKRTHSSGGSSVRVNNLAGNVEKKKMVNDMANQGLRVFAKEVPH